jgi:hypothetical protein
VNVERGPLLLVNAATPVFDVYDLEGQGKGPFSGYSSTQMFNTIPLATGATLRFHGLVFNDSGTLRMDCAQIDDGVAE